MKRRWIIPDVTVELEGTFDPEVMEPFMPRKCASIHAKTGKQCTEYDCQEGTLHKHGNLRWGGLYTEHTLTETETVEVEVNMHEKVDELARQIGYDVLRKWLG